MVISKECENYSVRIVGLDVGERRIGVAVSDATLTLARPVDVLRPASFDRDGPRLAAAAIARLADEEDGISSVVVGLPRRLDGTSTEMTARVEAFAAKLERLIGLPVIRQDERLTSREAESRLAVTDKDWRSRKERLDAAAAAIILQDYLDIRPGRLVPLSADPER
jgi:putative Holliday junction resolvase